MSWSAYTSKWREFYHNWLTIEPLLDILKYVVTARDELSTGDGEFWLNLTHMKGVFD